METNEKQNIISIRKANKQIAKECFADLMHKTELCMNDMAKHSPEKFTQMTSSGLEKISVQCMREVCITTPFRSEEIKLVAGLTFPDIITETYYGVEVKSTQSDNWHSTGSSIIEATRNKNIESIYMLFGKLGGIPKIRCKPYEECLYDITVTHSPRYLIDMNTTAKNTIFAKMGIPYNDFRTSKDSIAKVRKYYRNKAQIDNKKEMPWWLEDLEETSGQMMIRHFSAIPKEEQNKILTQMYILFPESMIKRDFVEPAMWLVSYHKIVSHNLRDYFSAGGKARFINREELKEPLPAIVKRFLDIAENIKMTIEQYKIQIEVFNPQLIVEPNLFTAWVKQVDSLFKKYIKAETKFPLWIANKDILTIK